MLHNAVSACLESWIVRGTPASSKEKEGGAEQNASNRGSDNIIGTRASILVIFHQLGSTVQTLRSLLSLDDPECTSPE